MKQYIISENSAGTKPTLFITTAPSREEAIACAVKALIPNYPMASVRVDTQSHTDIHVVYSPEDLSEDHAAQTYRESNLSDDAFVFCITEVENLQEKPFSATRLTPKAA
jgi:hypothetical protein